MIDSGELGIKIPPKKNVDAWLSLDTKVRIAHVTKRLSFCQFSTTWIVVSSNNNCNVILPAWVICL